MNILQFLNNGYDPKLILGYGGLGYKPPIYGYGIIEKDDEGEYVVDTEWNKKRSNYIINSEAPTKFLWSVFYNPDADEEDKKIVKEILDENYKNDPKKFIDKSNAYLDSLPPEEKNKRLVPVLDFYGQKVSQEVDDVSNYFKELKKVKKPETKEESESEEEEEESEGEESENEEIDEEGSVITLEGSDIEEEEDEVNWAA